MAYVSISTAHHLVQEVFVVLIVVFVVLDMCILRAMPRASLYIITGVG